MLTTNKTGISRFIENAVAQGMRHVVCSPGSRNAPLVIAIDNHPEMETVVVPDERAAGFFALGMAQQLKAPVGVVCTSGSAMLNYYPAVAEAYYQCVPLVVLSADRPEEWVNHGDGQTIFQRGVYNNHIHSELDIEEFIEPKDYSAFDSKIVESFEKATSGWIGPIHFNFPLSEPLYGTVEMDQLEVPPRKSNVSKSISESDKTILETAWNQSKKRMILCGQMSPDVAVLNALVDLCEDASVVVLVENTSNLIHPKFVHCIDRTLSAISEDEIKDFQPDLLITIGGAIISKRIKKFLRESSIENHLKIGFDFPEMDTYRKKTATILSEAGSVLKAIPALNTTAHPSQFGWKWKQKDFLIQEKMPSYVENAPYSDLTVFEVVLDSVPDSAHLHFANSSVVRYGQLFDPVKSIRYYANRGTSGIDGSSSTAAGASFAAKNDAHVLISGDLSFFYDSNAFWNNVIGENFRVIVINNGGGGIFRIIDGPNSTNQLENYFETHNKASVEGVCRTYHMEYLSARNLQEVESQLAQLFTMDTKGRPAVLEIVTPNTENNGVLKNFFKHFKSV
ncbi:MAG: 2-succinyl-5-enolpyruvyl-6-hydroxy-3-cyclohexene-1-carboxylic-acid synthase [Fluviicola sp. XM-24bin1]|nr:MAG: 2-succinyl-5-enolpyruvyl-6-hydroxy-3-cyclohexene-1-carboxylic-acid synthase [Fluviicola sp. XM-24bin1]